MTSNHASLTSVGRVFAWALVVISCKPAATGTGTRTIPVTPICTILCDVFYDNPAANPAVSIDGDVLVSDRTNPAISTGFTAFRGMSGPQGNPPVGFTADVYGISEAWLRNPAAPRVFRAQATPGRRTIPGGTDFKGSAWNVRVQDATGAWSPIFASGSANRGDEDSAEAAGITVPQLMPVGLANPQMFACAGMRTDDNSDRTTGLFDMSRGGTFIQDLLNGDDRFNPNKPGPLKDTPPTPPISGPGNPNRSGSVKCAMLQQDDDTTMRELHMVAIDHGHLVHSMVTSFSSATTGYGFRFSAFSPWVDVSQALGVNFGTITSAAIVASRPLAVSVFFVAQSGGVYRLWHTVRFASSGGSWRPADDVFALSGDTATGTVYSWKVAAGVCPVLGTPQNNELLVALWGGPNSTEVNVIRVVSTPTTWRPGVTSIYSPMGHIDTLLRGVDPARHPLLQNVVVTARPFSDNGAPAP